MTHIRQGLSERPRREAPAKNRATRLGQDWLPCLKPMNDSQERGTVRYDDKYPEKATLRVAFPGQLHGPFPPVAAAPFLEQSWRVYPCAECRQPTGWRTVLPGLSIATCSEECRNAVTAAMKPA